MMEASRRWFDDIVRTVALQSDGDLIVGGGF
jgi:hypothetical protein